MKKIINHLKENWIKHGFEALVVMIGILGAFTLSNWNEEVKISNRENLILKELLSNLNANVETFSGNIEAQQNSIKSIDFLLDHLEEGKPYHDTLAYYFSRLSFRSSITVSSSAYETLKSIGFNIISSDETRTEIIDLYERKYQGLINLVRDAEQQNINQNKSIIHNNFKANREYTAIPLDYAALQKDQKFISWLYRKQRWKRSLIVFNRHLLKSTNDLIKDVNDQLNY